MKEQEQRELERTPTVSIIIPAYKVANFIRETIDSVLAQTFSDYEIILINDGSPDTDELERALTPYQSSIVYVKQENRGAGAARNAGLMKARGRHVAFLDGDDVWFPSFLGDQMRLIETDGGYDLVYADGLKFGNPMVAGHTSMEESPSEGRVTPTALISGQCTVLTSTVLARKKLLHDVGMFDESFPNSQDFDLWFRLVKDGHARVTYQRKCLVGRRMHSGSLASDAVKSLTGELSVLAKIGSRSDLTEEERAVLEETIQKRRATIKMIEGKRSLVNGDYDCALQSFELANRHFRRWKLRLLILGLHLAPQLIRLIYQRTITGLQMMDLHLD